MWPCVIVLGCCQSELCFCSKYNNSQKGNHVYIYYFFTQSKRDAFLNNACVIFIFYTLVCFINTILLIMTFCKLLSIWKHYCNFPVNWKPLFSFFSSNKRRFFFFFFLKTMSGVLVWYLFRIKSQNNVFLYLQKISFDVKIF